MKIDKLVVTGMLGDVLNLPLDGSDITLQTNGERVYEIRVRGRTLELEQMVPVSLMDDATLRAYAAKKWLRP